MQFPSLAGGYPSGRLRRALSAAVLALAGTACQDNNVTGPASTETFPPAFSTGATQGTSAAGSIVSRVSPTRCMDVLGTGATHDPRIGIYSCDGSAEQQFVSTAAGELRNGAMCVDVAGAGRSGDAVIGRACSGSANQRWARTSDGTIRGINGRCIEVPGGNTANATKLVLNDCRGGTNQIWDNVRSTATATAAMPKSTVKPSAVLAFMGAASVPGVAAVQAKGGVYARYESNFSKYEQYQWTLTANGIDSTSFEANFYDRAMIYYVWWARTGDATYLDRANKLAVSARTYLEGLKYYPMTYNMMLDGVALHALVTGDQRSATTVAKVADNLANPNGWFSYVAGHAGDAEGDSRNSARILAAVLDAYLLKVNSPAGYNYAKLLPDLERRILATQSADGAYRWPNQCNSDKPFMTGMLNDALIRYYTSFQPDTHIPGAVKKAVDYLWANDWVAGSQGFRYLGAYCSNPNSGGTNGPTPDLNSLIVSGFSFVAKHTGDASYNAKADAVFAGGVASAWLNGPKQFNQAYTASYRYLALRF
ncbi:hypothetical protein tb265_31420 [Gemmatimonadetes bacterium T265]|nr:hypothetical protein tb265_31420 [Gemmatimonadetes bacterium T265]